MHLFSKEMDVETCSEKKLTKKKIPSLNSLYTANYKPYESLVAPKVHFNITNLN